MVLTWVRRWVFHRGGHLDGAVCEGESPSWGGAGCWHGSVIAPAARSWPVGQADYGWRAHRQSGCRFFDDQHAIPLLGGEGALWGLQVVRRGWPRTAAALISSATHNSPRLPSRARHTRPALANGAPAMSEPERPRRRCVLTGGLRVRVSTHGPLLAAAPGAGPQGSARAHAGT